MPRSDPPHQDELFDDTHAGERDDAPDLLGPKLREKPSTAAPVEGGANGSASRANMPAGSTERYLSVKDLCNRYSVSPATIRRWASTNPGFPGPKQLSPGVTRWALSDLLAFEASPKRTIKPERQVPAGSGQRWRAG